MFCHNCGGEVQSKDMICPHCGVILMDNIGDEGATEYVPQQNYGGARICPSCGSEVPEGDMFCQNCGTNLSQAGGAGGYSDPGPAPYAQNSYGQDSYGQDPYGQDSYSPRRQRYDEGGGSNALMYCLAGLVGILLIAGVVAGVIFFRNSRSGGDTKTAKSKSGSVSKTEKEGEGDVTVSIEPKGEAGTTTVPTVTVTLSPTPTAVPPTPVPVSGDYIFPESSTSYLSSSQVNALSIYDMYLARNEIYARHGRMFNNADLQQYFGSKSWYTPTYQPADFDARQESIFNDVEKENIRLIKSIETSLGSPYL